VTITKITVVGAGTMGSGIAHVFAQNGFEVTLNDIKQEFLEKSLATMSANMDRQVKKGTLTEEAKRQTAMQLAEIEIMKQREMANMELMKEQQMAKIKADSNYQVQLLKGKQILEQIQLEATLEAQMGNEITGRV